MPAPADESAAVCGVCGTSVQGPAPLTWSSSRGPRGTAWTCELCTRTHLRAMEAKLDEEHW